MSENNSGFRPWGGRVALALLLATALVTQAAATDPPAATGASAATKERLVRNGVVVEFEASEPYDGRKVGLMEGDFAELRFRISEEATGQPVQGNAPGVWMDMGEVIQGQPDAEQKSCKDKIALYLKGVVGIRPMLDLNSYYILVLNHEPTVSVVDPLVSMVGVTSTLAMIRLKANGADWTKSQDEQRVFISMPKAGQVAVLDADAFKVAANIDAGREPTRVALQPDGRFLWVGNNAATLPESGVTVIDTVTLAPVGHVSTGLGHHEIAFSADSRYAFVSNRDAGTVTVIDVASRDRLADVATGPLPISLAYSPLAQALYVADGKAGTVTVLGGSGFQEVLTRIELRPGLGPLRITEDGRWAMTVNPSADAVYVIDTATNALVHTLTVKGEPFEVVFSRAFAYVRALASERVTMVNLSSLGQGKEPIAQSFAAGAVAPKVAGDLVIADSLATSETEAAAFVVNPGDNTTYFYMEGMNAPTSNYQVYGAQARAAMVVDRSLKEVEPGLYTSKVKLPAAGRYDVAFLLETPRLLHCFSLEAKANPRVKHAGPALKVEYLNSDLHVPAGMPAAFEFRLLDPITGAPRSGVAGVSVLSFRVPGIQRTEVAAEEVGDGVYRAMVPISRPGSYQVTVGVPAERVGYGDLPSYTLIALRLPPGGQPPPAQERQP